MSGDPDRDLDHKDAEEDVVEDAQRVANLALDRVVGLQPKRHRIDEDHGEDEQLELL